MTRINTNVGSLYAQNCLARSNASLSEALTRLSTGLRINVGKDDPAGLIASEILKSDIVSTQKAISNSQMANQMISTADSALGQISSLLNDIRGLVSEAANTGAMSEEQISANQLQIDSSLDAIDRIAQTTQFQGRKLLDGNLDFITTGVDNTKITGLQINQANFGTQTEIALNVNVVSQATKGTLNYGASAIGSDVVLEVGGNAGTQAFSFASGSTIAEMASAINLVSDATGVSAQVNTASTAGHITVSNLGANNDITLTANTAGQAAGDFRVKFSAGTSAGTTVDYTAAYGADPGMIDVQLQTQAWTGASGLRLDESMLTSTTAAYTWQESGGNAFTLTAKSAGAAYHGATVQVVNDATLIGNSASLEWDGSNKILKVHVNDGTTTEVAVLAAFTAAGAEIPFSAVNGTADATLVRADTGVPAPATYTLTQTADGVGDSNNALDITSKVTGTSINNTDVHFVDGNGTQAGITANFVQASSTIRGVESATPANNNNVFTISAKAGGAYDGNVTQPTITITNAGGYGVTWNETANTLAITANLAAVSAAQLVNQLKTGGYTGSDGTALTDAFDFATVGSGSAALGAGMSGYSATMGAVGALTQLDATYRTAAAGTATLQIQANAGTVFSGENGNRVTLQMVQDVTFGTPVAAFDETTGLLTVTGDFTGVGVSQVAMTTALGAAKTVQGHELDEIFTFTVAGVGDFTTADAGSMLLTAVAGKITAATAGTGDTNAVAGVGYNHEQITYSNDATAAKVALNGFNATTNSALTLTATTAGSAYNDVRILFVDDSADSATWTDAQYTAGVKTADAVLTIHYTGAASLFSDVLGWINAEGHFNADLDDSVDTTNTGGGIVAAADSGMVFNTYNSGGDAGTLFINVEHGETTAQGVIDALSRAGNERASNLFTISNSTNSDGSGLVFTRDAGASTVTRNNNTRVDALTGGTVGGAVVATAQQVIDQINATAGLSDLITAALGTGNTGIAALTEFQEYSYYGDVATGTRIQFLGGEGARDIRFVSAPGTALSADLTTDPEVTAKSSVTMAAYSDNASMVFRAVTQGSQYDDTVIRFNALATGETTPTVTYSAEPSAAQAFIDLGAFSTGDFRLTATEHSADFNGVSVYITADGSISGSNDASVSYNATTKRLTINIDDTNATTIAKVMEKINAEGTFSAEMDYRTNPSATSAATINAGIASTTAVGNTGTTGGHEGGVLEFNVVNGTTTASDIVNLLTADDLANKYFQVTLLGTSGAGTINVNEDTNKAITSGGVTDTGTLVVHLATDANGLVTTTAQDLVDYLNTSAAAATAGISASLAQGATGTGLLAATTADLAFATNGTQMTDAQASGEVSAVHGINARYTVTAVNPGTTYDGVTLVYENDLSATGSETAEYIAASKVITVHVKMAGVGDTSTASQVITAINRDLATLFTATLSGTGAGEVASQDTLLLAGGQVDTGSVNGASFLDNSDAAQTGLKLMASEYGSAQFVSVKSITGSLLLTDDDGTVADRASGTDVNLRINGIQAIGKGLNASISTSSLDLSFAVASTVTDGTNLTFNIVGGGSQFQLGPDVVSNQQARLGIQSISSAKLGGSDGRLFQLRSGATYDLATDTKTAAKIVEEVITQVTTLRGRLGAFQKTTLDTNIAALNDSLQTLTDAQSNISDADFATETANLTRAQILVQSGLSVLKIANSNPQNVLSLLQ
jgi:flagellin